MPEPIRHRIKAHRRVRAGDLVPHELNYRLRPAGQRAALLALYEEVGFARSLLGYELPDGRLKLIDGHLRRDLDPGMEVDVELLDMDDAEARKLLLRIDPLAALAETEAEVHRRLLEMTPTCSAAPHAAWQSAAEAVLADEGQGRGTAERALPEQYLVLIRCSDEAQQTALLGRLQGEGLTCRALVS